MTTPRTAAIFLSALALAVLLAGCTGAAPQPSPAPTTSPSASTPTPTPIAANAAAIPLVRVPVHCADLLTPAAASALTGATLKTTLDENSRPTTIRTIGERQAGILNCQWDNASPTRLSFAWISIAPDATAAFSTNFGSNTQDKPVVTGTAGDKSEYRCRDNAQTPEISCIANMLVGDYWVTATVVSRAGGQSLAAGKKRIQSVLERADSVVAAAGASLPAWARPTGSLVRPCSNGARVRALRVAFAEPKLIEQSPDDASYVADSSLVWVGTEPISECGQVTASGNFVASTSILDGGSWAVPGLVASPPREPEFGVTRAITVTGAPAATIGCQHSMCRALLSVGTSVVHVQLRDNGTGRNAATLARVVVALTTS